MREGISVHHVSLKSTRDYAVYQAIEAGKVDHIELLEAIIYDLTWLLLTTIFPNSTILFLMAAKAQRPAEREAGLFERSIFLDRQLYSSCERAAKEIVSEKIGTLLPRLPRCYCGSRLSTVPTSIRFG